MFTSAAHRPLNVYVYGSSLLVPIIRFVTVWSSLLILDIKK